MQEEAKTNRCSEDDLINKVIQGNSLEVLKTIPDEFVNLIITSPPYFGCRVYGKETLGRELHPNEYIDNLFLYMHELKRVLHKHGSFYLNMGDVYFGSKGFSRNKGKWERKTDHHYKEHKIVKPDGKYIQHKQLLLLPSRLAIKMQEEDGWVVRNQIIWEKPNPIPSHSPDRKLPVYEYIYHFVKDKKYFFDYAFAKKLGHHRDVIKVGIEPFGKHQATFPLKLIQPLLLITSKEQDIVMDPFMGSGTVGVAAKKNNRRYIGIELHKSHCRDAQERIDNTKVDVIRPEDILGDGTNTSEKPEIGDFENNLGW
jgi:site-specific DNA-methyltransferase (adenine-specific)